MRFIIAQLLGGLAIIASILAFQYNKHNKIIFFRTLNEFLGAVHYILLGAYTGAAVNLIGCVRNYIFTKLVEKNKKTAPYIILFSVLFAAFGILTWQGKLSILIIAAKILSTIAYGNKNATVVRILTLLTSSSWLIYNISVLSITGSICEAMTLISIISGIIRFDIIHTVRLKHNKLC